MVSYESMGQTSIVNSDREYIGWSYISIQGNKLVIYASNNIYSYANPTITPILTYYFVKKFQQTLHH